MKKRLILDCSTLLPGPFVGKLLAKQGARVIKIENPDRPDGAKAMGSAYEDLNSCKEIQFLNLTLEEDHEKFRGLIKQADGLIEGFRPKAKKKLGLDEGSLLRINPQLCIASLVGYPEESPWAERAGHDLNFQALTGCLSLFHEMPALPLADLFGAYHAAVALTSAMDAVQRGSPGRRVVISLSETLREVQSLLICEYQKSRQVPRPGETLFSGKFPCYRIYTARDGKRISVGAIENKFWTNVCEIIGKPELTNQGYASGIEGKAVIQAVQTAFQSRNWEEWAPLFEKADCCVEPVLDYSEVYLDGLQS